MPLPLPDCDNLPVGSLQHRIRSLTADEGRPSGRAVNQLIIAKEAQG
ncbi:hypothetical protein [Saccharopolyspora halophila]